MSTITIKHRFTGAVLFSFEATAEQQNDGLALRHALEAATAAKVNLFRADLRGSNLSGSDLSGSDLRDSDLSGSDLRYANLSGSDLRDSDLSGSDLRGSDLSGSNLSGSNLRYANLRDSNLSGSDLRGSDLRGSDLRGSNLRYANLRDSNLSGSDLRGSDLRGSDLRGSNLRYANLSGSNLSGSDLRGSDLRGSDLRGSDLRGSDRATDEQAITNLDKVREIILDNQARLEMGHWHDDNSKWREHTCAEETLCETTHCLAGWLQVCSTDDRVRSMDAQYAGIVAAPVAAKMFFRAADEVIDWLQGRKYVAEIEEGNRRAAERAAKKAEAQS